jgi:dTDP-4-amino-4,6-dideoxy-D-galactose acyltransferase
LNYEILNWDSDFFGFKVAKVSGQSVDENSYKNLLDDLKSNGIRLTYLVLNLTDKESNNVIQEHIQPIDIKVTCVNNLIQNNSISSDNIYEYIDTKPTEELKSLALDAGKFSRFRLDKRFIKGTYDALYSKWLINSLNKKIANHVFVYEEEKNILGFITVKISGETGTIGLVAVSENARGRGIGKSLIMYLLSFLKSKNINSCSVATQGANSGALKLYKSCGLVPVLHEAYYHIWTN